MASDIKKIIVTGSSGTIGTRLMQRLNKEGFDLIGIDIIKNKWIKKINPKTKLIDLRNKKKLINTKIRADIIIHLAANSRVYNLIKNPLLARDNTETIFNTLEFARKNNIKKIIFSSSREVYGETKKLMNKENDARVYKCENPYAASKIYGESLIHSFSKCFGIEYIIFRFSNIYGMYDISDRVIPIFIKRIFKNKNIEIFGKKKYLDFIYIDDAIEAIFLGINSFNKSKNNTYNIASGTASSIISVAKYLLKKIRSKSKIMIKNNRTGEVASYNADISKAKNIINFKAVTSLRTGLDKTILWYRKNQL